MPDDSQPETASLTLVRRIAAPIDTVYAAISDAALLKLWLGPKAFELTEVTADARVGGGFAFRMRDLGGGWFGARGTYLEVVPGERVTLSWMWTEAPEGETLDDVESRLTIALRVEGDGTVLTLTHARLGGAASAESHREGWSQGLDKLEAHFASTLDPTAIEGLVRRYTAAWVARDRATVEAIVASDFRFTSPLDNQIDRATFFTRCWPPGDEMAAFELRHVHPRGVRAFVAYELRMKDGRRFVNTELWTFGGGQLVAVEVYFGWPVPHDAPPGGFKPQP